MPPKKANNKKQTKTAPSVDGEMVNNLKKELEVEEVTDSKTLTNGSEILEEQLKETSKAKATKRGSGRTKNSAPTEEEVTSVVKPAAKGKGKKKKEFEVIQNENEIKQEIKEEETEADAVESKAVVEEITQKPQGRGGGGKKSKANSKKAKSSNETEKTQDAVENTVENVQEQMPESTELEKPEKKTKASGGKRKKQETSEKETDTVEVKPDGANKKSSRGAKKAAETSSDVEPQKKRGKSNPKEESHENDQVESSTSGNVSNETKMVTKTEKKPTKRGRNASKTASEMEEVAGGQNGDVTEEVLPKKRSRKAVNDNKQTTAEKPKKGRGKKIDNVSDNIEEAPATSLEENDIATNGDIKEEILENIEESPKRNKKIVKKTEELDDASSKTETKARGGGGRKRAATSTNKKSKTAAEDKMDNGEDNGIEDEADGDSKPSKTKKKKDSAPLNPTGTTYNKEDFELAPLPEGETAEEPRYNLKISSWNVAGLRSWLKKEGLKFLEYEQPDIFCLQEIKCTTDQLPEEVERIPGYHPYWLCMPGGYAGVAIYSKIMPINVEYGIGNKEFDECGRIITAEYEKFFLINVYVPNSGRKLVNLDARMKWEKIFQEFVQKLDARKPVVICGDMNVSHQEIDLANPKTNTRNAGFTKEEREKMTELLSLGYIDTFRHLYPDRKGAYTFWTYMGNARARNVGWRLDYFIVSERFIKRVVDNCIRNQCMGSDHCPITLFMKL